MLLELSYSYVFHKHCFFFIKNRKYGTKILFNIKHYRVLSTMALQAGTSFICRVYILYRRGTLVCCKEIIMTCSCLLVIFYVVCLLIDIHATSHLITSRSLRPIYLHYTRVFSKSKGNGL